MASWGTVLLRKPRRLALPTFAETANASKTVRACQLINTLDPTTCIAPRQYRGVNTKRIQCGTRVSCGAENRFTMGSATKSCVRFGKATMGLLLQLQTCHCNVKISRLHRTQRASSPSMTNGSQPSRTILSRVSHSAPHRFPLVEPWSPVLTFPLVQPWSLSLLHTCVRTPPTSTG